MNPPLTHIDDEGQRSRLQRLYLGAASSILTFAITLLVAWFGYLPYPVAMRYAALVVFLFAVFYGLIRSGFSLRFAHPSLTGAQIVAAGIATSYVVFEGHAARPAFMFFYLTAFMVGVV